MHYLILITLFLVGCVTGPTETIKPTPELVARQFGDVVFSNEIGNQDSGLMRWPRNKSVGMALTADRARAQQFNDVGDRVGAMLLRETSATFVPAQRPEDARYLIFLAPRWQLDALKLDAALDYQKCFFALKTDADHNITHAIIGIDSTLDDDRVRHCLAEELTQSMGLRDDACDYRPSLFCEGDSHLHAPTNADRLMLRTLYDPALQPGMTKDIAMPIARRLIRERWGEYMN